MKIELPFAENHRIQKDKNDYQLCIDAKDSGN